jgi:hypothetical protein
VPGGPVVVVALCPGTVVVVVAPVELPPPEAEPGLGADAVPVVLVDFGAFFSSVSACKISLFTNCMSS